MSWKDLRALVQWAKFTGGLANKKLQQDEVGSGIQDQTSNAKQEYSTVCVEWLKKRLGAPWFIGVE